MFMSRRRPVGVVPNPGQGDWTSLPDIPFDFDLANPNLFLKHNLQGLYLLSGKQAAFRAGLKNMATGRGESFHGNFKGERTESQHYHLQANDFDQSMVWFQNMEDPNDAFRGPTANGPAHNEFALAPSNNPKRVSLSSSSSNNHGHVHAHARRHPNANPGSGGLKTEASTNNADDLCTWSATPNTADFNHNFAQSINARGSQKWPTVPVPSNEYIQAYGFPTGLADGLPVFSNNQAFTSSFELGPAMGAMGGVTNADSSSSSSCRINGSSPNTLFGSFSSSIGPQDMMDMDVKDGCFHSPSVFPSDALTYHNPGAIPQAFLSHSPANDFPVNPRAVFPEAETVSPKMLHINTGPSLPSSSSSESLPNPFRMDSDPELPSAVVMSQQDILPSSAWQARRESNTRVNTAGRKQLPDKAPHSKTSGGSSNGPKRRHGGDVTGDKTAAPSSKKSKAKGKGTSQSQHQSRPQTSSSHHQNRHQQTGGSGHRGNPGGAYGAHTKASSSKATTSAGGAGFSGSSGVAEASTAALPPRSEKDEYLVQSKLAGMTYKEIRKQGGFTEAESTLRGRFRTLTKPKEARVRKPEFQEIDDKLLKRAVVKLTKDVDEITRDNVPWKLVAEYMVDHGGSYLFGYTTVRKRWEYLMVTSEEQVKQDRLNQQSAV